MEKGSFLGHVMEVSDIGILNVLMKSHWLLKINAKRVSELKTVQNVVNHSQVNSRILLVGDKNLVAQIDESLFNGLCVFCRLEEREQYFDDYEVPMARRTNDARSLSRTSFAGARQVRRTLQSTLSMHHEQED